MLNKFKITLLLSLFIIAPFGFQVNAEEHYIVIISIDGFPADALEDEDIPLPNLRQLAESGVHGEAMRPSNPTNTWPNHTTLVTGVSARGHGMLHNGYLTFDTERNSYFVDNATNRYLLVDVPTLYDAAHDAGLSTAEVNWPGTRDSESLDFSIPDVLYSIEHTTPQLRQALIDEGILRKEDVDDPFLQRSAPGRDEVWNSAARYVIEQHQPNLLLHHLLNVDTVHHLHGVDTSAGFTALSLADRHVGDIIESLEHAGIRERTTVFIVSDHGFMNVDYTLYPNVLFAREGLLQIDETGEITDAKVQVISTGGTAMIKTGQHAGTEDDLKQARQILEEAEGIRKIIEPDDYVAYGLPHPDENEQMGELFLVAGDGYGFANEADQDSYLREDGRLIGYHGYLNDHPEMKTVFIASGYGIREGMQTGKVDNRSIAPTVAELLDITYEIPELPVLEEILAN